MAGSTACTASTVWRTASSVRRRRDPDPDRDQARCPRRCARERLGRHVGPQLQAGEPLQADQVCDDGDGQGVVLAQHGTEDNGPAAAPGPAEAGAQPGDEAGRRGRGQVLLGDGASGTVERPVMSSIAPTNSPR